MYDSQGNPIRVAQTVVDLDNGKIYLVVNLTETPHPIFRFISRRRVLLWQPDGEPKVTRTQLPERVTALSQ